MCYGECDLGIADDGGRGRRRQFGDVPASSHPLRDGSMTMEGVGNTEPCSRTLVLPSHYMKLYPHQPLAALGPSVIPHNGVLEKSDAS